MHVILRLKFLQPRTLHAFLLHAPSSYRGVGFNLTGCTSAFTDGAVAHDAHLDVLEGVGIYSPDPMETTENDTAPRAFSGTVEYVLHDNGGGEPSSVVEQGAI